MGKLPVLKDRELIRALHELGFFEHRQHGTNHLIMKHSDGRMTCVPVHPGSDIPRGTLHAILNDIRISVDALEKVL